MSRRVPPLNPLHVFEVVARRLNLTAAAQELHVTQSAVSRQIGVLETYLGVALFRRQRHGVTLTRSGRVYAEQVVAAFETIAAATEQLLKGTSQGALRLRTYTTFAAKWLIPRLPDFERRHPGIEVRITTAVPEVDFDRDPVDVAIQYGDGRWPQVHADLLFHDEIEPVCSPRFLAERAASRARPECLLHERLLVSHYRRSDWDDWLAATALADQARAAERMSFASSVLTWQAALDGLGLAVGQTPLLAAELAAGKLVRPFANPVHTGKAFYLLRPKVQRELHKVGVFRDWLLATCAPTEALVTGAHAASSAAPERRPLPSQADE